ncbi:MAG: TetR/AcrR family transcriptional regulator [Acidimicrobiales bacterium]
MVRVSTDSTGASGVITPEELVLDDATVVKPMRVDAQRNHDKILQAAEEIFALDGVTVPIDTVAERAGVGIGTLYRHFPTKEALYEAIVVTRIDELIGTAEAYIRDTDAVPSAALDAFLREFASQASAKRDLFEALEQSGFDFKARFAHQVDELLARIDVLRQRAVDAGTIRGDVETADIMNLVMGTCHAAGNAGTDDLALQRCVGIVIAGLQPTSSR